MLIEIHMIQNHSPANMNRDDLGAPKTCLFGGVPRARISSQCLKRAIRAPRNPNDIHNRSAGIFSEAMAAHIGCRTKLFPWLVGLELEKSEIPADERPRIVLAAQRIAVTKEKEEKKKSVTKGDERPKTPQLIHLGPNHAKQFVEKLQQLRGSHEKEYQHYLDPRVGFQQMVGNLLDEDVSDKAQKAIVNASWVIANRRMRELLRSGDGEEEQPEPDMKDGQPTIEHAKLIAERLTAISVEDPKRFQELTKVTGEEKRQAKPEDPPDFKKFKAELKSANRYDAVDIALFGRMTTSEAFEDVEAAMQVAHAISTNEVVNETDYFTALDDKGKTGGGAAHVDEAMYNSACFYKYFSLDWDQLVSNLAGPEPDAKKDAEAHKNWEDKIKPNAEKLAAASLGHFIRAAAMTTPGGRQNSFASHCDPCGILIEIKKAKTPTSYANAFAEPVRRIGKPDDDAADEHSLEGRSVACMAEHVQAIRQAYRIDSTLLWYSPKLWRFPFRYWERSEDGEKRNPRAVTDRRYSAIEDLVAAVVTETGFKWSDVRNIGREV